MDEQKKTIENLISEVKNTSLKTAASMLIPLFFDVVTDMLCVISPNGEFALVSKSWSNELGYQLDELIGKPFTDFVYEEDRHRTDRAFVKYNIEDNSLDHYYYNRYKKKGGGYVWLRWEPEVNKAYQQTGFIMGVATPIHNLQIIQLLENGITPADTSS